MCGQVDHNHNTAISVHNTVTSAIAANVGIFCRNIKEMLHTEFTDDGYMCG